MKIDPLSFPEASRGALDRAIDDLVDRAQDVLATQGRLRALLKANQAVIEQLDLPVMLRRIVESAVELVGARFGALGVISPMGGLEQFIHVGMSEAEADAIGQLPEGHGLLAALIESPMPIRLEHLADDPRFGGFPAHHPAMESFLGVPVLVRNEVFGNLYLSKESSNEFSAEDEQLVEALAATAGVAIDNARLFAETRRRQAWAASSAEVTAAMLSSELNDPVAIVVGRVLELAEADLVTVVVPARDPDYVVVSVARGIDEDVFTGRQYSASDTLAGKVLEGGQPRLIDETAEFPVVLSDGRSIGPVMALPLISAGRTEGVLLVGRAEGGHFFTASDLEMAADFAGQASVALELIRTRATHQRMVLLEDRGRISRDLHDHVVQQLFGTGLELQSVAGSLNDEPLAKRVMQIVSNLDAAIAQIRTVIFAMSTPASNNRAGIRHRIIDLAHDVAVGLARAPTVSFSGPVDLVVTGSLADDVLAVVREGLTNVVKHAKASNTALTLRITESAVELSLIDDGVGMSGSRRSGLANLEARASSRGGRFTVESASPGTRVVWTVPIPDNEGDSDA